MNCDRCGGDMLDLTGGSAMFTFRCPQCGHEVSGVLDVMGIVPPPPVWVRMFVAWRGGRATPVQVARLRKLFPDVANRSIQQIFGSATTRLTMPLGRFPEWEADQLVAKGREMNLDLRYARITEDSDGTTAP